MAERFSAFAGGVASGTDKTIINLFNAVASPTGRGSLYYLTVGCVATPADQAAKFYVGRTTAVGTEGAGFAPNNHDSGGPAGEFDAGVGVFSAEPTYTSNKELLVFSLNQRATYQFQTDPMYGFKLPATQNAGAGLKTKSSTSTQAYEATIFFEE